MPVEQPLIDKLIEVEVANQRVMMLTRRLAALEGEIAQLHEAILEKKNQPRK